MKNGSEHVRVTHRRRVVTGAGLALMVVATACAASACIFDQGEYKGGGRLGRAATAQQEKPEEQEQEPAPEDTTPPTSTTSSPLPDTGAPGG